MPDTGTQASSSSTRHIVVLATPTAQSLEVAAPVEVFSTARIKLQEAGRELSPSYRVTIAACSHVLDIRSSTSGLRIMADRPWFDIDEPVDTLLVAGGMTLWTGADHPALLDWVRAVAGRARRTASVCTGAFVLAEAGLLHGRRVTTHWYFSQKLQQDYPTLTVDPQPLYIRDGNVVTAAGVASGLDLSLALVEDDLGIDIAFRVARALVLFVRRTGGESQFSTALAFQSSSHLPLRELPLWLIEHLHETLTVETLAARVAMSPRNFARVFAKEFGSSPSRFIEQLRIDTARRFLTESDSSLEHIAQRVGFGSVDTMNRAFRRHAHALPSQLRAHT